MTESEPPQETKNVIFGFIRNIRKFYPINVSYYNFPISIANIITRYFYEYLKWNLDLNLRNYFELINDKIICKISDESAWCNISFGLEVTDQECDKMDIHLKCIEGRIIFVIGYIANIEQNRQHFTWINVPLGDMENKPYSSGIYINSINQHFVYCDKTYDHP